jgi:hypothetical protein
MEPSRASPLIGSVFILDFFVFFDGFLDVRGDLPAKDQNGSFSRVALQVAVSLALCFGVSSLHDPPSKRRIFSATDEELVFSILRLRRRIGIVGLSIPSLDATILGCLQLTFSSSLDRTPTQGHAR